jgi:S-formylglutathione hydrolase FrmB
VPPDPALLAGRVDVHLLDSEVLRGNPLGDPSTRPLWVQVPHGYDGDGEPLPVVYLLQGYFSRLADWDARVPFRPTVPETIDARMAAGAAPAIVVYVDAWTAFGGSQFVDSPAVGRYAQYVADEVVDFVDARYRTRADPAHRAVAGHSSGGLGALLLALTRPDRFSALASHAGDALYEYLYIPVFARAVRALRSYGGDLGAWWADMRARTALTRPEDESLAMLLGCAAAFSPGPGPYGVDAVPDLPFDPVTGVLRDDVWSRWLATDPVRLVPEQAATAAALRAVWLDGGTSDEWFLEIGATAVADALRDAGLDGDRLRLELFDGGHERVEHRFADAVVWLAERMA